MKTKSKISKKEVKAIREVFCELGLEDPKSREHFLQMANLSDWHSWQENRRLPQDTRNNTSGKGEYDDA